MFPHILKDLEVSEDCSVPRQGIYLRNVICFKDFPPSPSLYYTRLGLFSSSFFFVVFWAYNVCMFCLFLINVDIHRCSGDFTLETRTFAIWLLLTLSRGSAIHIFLVLTFFFPGYITKTRKGWPDFFKFLSMSILAIHTNRWLETDSMLNCGKTRF